MSQGGPALVQVRGWDAVPIEHGEYTGQAPVEVPSGWAWLSGVCTVKLILRDSRVWGTNTIRVWVSTVFPVPLQWGCCLGHGPHFSNLCPPDGEVRPRTRAQGLLWPLRASLCGGYCSCAQASVSPSRKRRLGLWVAVLGWPSCGYISVSHCGHCFYPVGSHPSD